MFKRRLNFFLVFFLAIIVFSCSRIDSGHDEESENNSVEEDAQIGDVNSEIILTPEIVKEINLKFATAELVPDKAFVSARGVVIPQPERFSRVGSLIPGRIRKIHKNIGDRVKPGEPLFEITSLDFSEIVSEFISARTRLDVAESNYNRTAGLFNDGIGSEKDYLFSKSEFQTAKGHFKAVFNRIRSLGLTEEEIENIQKSDLNTFTALTVKSPISGVVTKANLTLGRYATAEETLMEITDSRQPWVRITLNEKDFRSIRVGNPIEVKSATIQELFFGKITKISNSIDRETRSIDLIGELEKSGLVVNSFVKVNILLSDEKTLAVPELAVQYGGDDYLVFVETEHNSFAARKVVAGNRFREYVQILSGLKVGDRVVTQGSFFLKAKLREGEFQGDDD